MKKIFFLAMIAGIINTGEAQIWKKVIDKTKQKTENKVSEKISDKVSDAASKPIDEIGKKKSANTKGNDGNVADNSSGSSGNNGSTTSNTGSQEQRSAKTDGNSVATNESEGSLATYSKYDFIPGEKILVFEDFSQDAIGDFPDKWNTNSSGEVVTANNQSGHWLMVSKKGRFIPEYITDLPENFTLQYDVICNENFSFYSNPLHLYFVTGSNDKKALEYSFIPMEKRSGVKIGVHPANAASNGGTAYIESYDDGEKVINNEVNTTQFNAKNGKTKLKVSVWRQKQRIRVYLNEEKVFDLPRAFPAGKTYSTVMFEIWSGMNNDADRYLISNIKLAVGAPDTRNKLITEGKFVTSGILFDVNSDQIKPESYSVLKDIATVLSENPSVSVKIVGHTDSDGNDADNRELSKRRANAVKNALAGEFKIDASRMQTDGKGESQPIDKNDTPQGKANNRRVEFIKQ
jgi:OmpA-OmpF porin, OOP family